MPPSSLFHIFLCALHVYVGCTDGGDVLKAKPLKCPRPETYYAIPSFVPFTINAASDENPEGVEYEWDVLSTNGIDMTSVLTNNEDTDTLWLVNEDQEGEIQLRVTLTHNTRSVTPCVLKLIYSPPPYFGIDLGTTFSCIAYQFPDLDRKTLTRTTQIIKADTSNKRQNCVPTAVYFPAGKKDKLLFGYEAREKLSSDPENVIYDIKRIIGRKWSDVEVQQFRKNHLFNIVQKGDDIEIVIPNRNIMISPEQALAVILKHLVHRAKKQVDIVSKASVNVVISVPAFFHNGQRRAIKSAAKLADLDAKLLVVEPTAGAIAHTYYSAVPEDDSKLFMVFDYGGGTLDCSVMRCVGMECEVLAVSGNSTLGGIDFDHVIKQIIVDKLVKSHGVKKSEIDELKLLQDSEAIKISLSKNDRRSYKYEDKPEIVIRRTEFENHAKTKKLLKCAMDTAKKAIDSQEKFVASNIRMILMIGGTSNVPIVQQTLRKTFTRETLKLEFPEMDPQLMVLTGSAVLAGSMAYDRILPVSDVIPLPLGFKVCRGKYGAEGTSCDNMSVMINKNTRYPLKVNKTSCPHDPASTSSHLSLYEGEDDKTGNNHFLSQLLVKNILPRDPETGVCNTFHAVFEIDKDGIVTVQGVAHKADGSDGDVYSMSLPLSLSVSTEQKIKKELGSWLFAKEKVKEQHGWFEWLFKTEL